MPGLAAAQPELVHRIRFWPWVVILVLTGAAWFTRASWLPLIPRGMAGEKPGAAKAGAKPVPVRVAQVVQHDMPEYLTGLGTVTAFKTVTLRSRVDGELIKVAFTEGQNVSEGDLLAEIDPRPYKALLDQAEGMLAKDEAALSLAELTLARGKELVKKQSLAPQQLDEEAAAVATMKGTVQTDRGLVANARLQLAYCRIVAPITGRIGLRLVDQGNMVHANDLVGMAVITQLQPISLVFPIPQDNIPRVQRRMNEGQVLPVDAYDRDFKQQLAAGKLAAIDNQVDALSGTLRFKAVFDNKDDMLFPNQFVNAKLLVDTRKNAIIVPSAAVQRGPNGVFVYVVMEDETVDLRYVKAGYTEGAETLIETGLAPGEIVVTDGLDKLKKGAKVTTREKDQEQGPKKKKDHSPDSTQGEPEKSVARAPDDKPKTASPAQPSTESPK
ncbi:MAG TPA: MdtA/MuxA family multidrug efflux RND transporter periplasmic adaptor subunit [Planctomycetaceae bacterium]|jgi:multidrug efflux system membrane fusion protein